MTLDEYQLKYGELSPHLKELFRVCTLLLDRNIIPTPRNIWSHSLGRIGPKLNGRESKLRIQLLEEYGCEKINGRWRVFLV